LQAVPFFDTALVLGSGVIAVELKNMLRGCVAGVEAKCDLNRTIAYD